MAKIEQLTKEQEELLPKFREEWLRHGLSTEPTDRQRAEEGMRLIYEAAGLDPPKHVFWFTSPALGSMAVKSVNWLEGDQQGDQLWDQLGDQLRDQLGDQYEETWFWGGWDSYWIAFYDFGRQIGVQYDEKAAKALDGYMAVAQSAGWWWPYKDVVIMTDRPTAIRRDSQNRLHYKHGAALEYSDGYGLWAWNGTRVPQNVIEDDPTTWTVEQVMGESNVEIRRVMFERIGWDKVVDQFGMQQVGESMDDPGNPGQTLAIYDMPESVLDIEARILLCTNGTIERDGTRRRFGLGIPADIKTPLEAQSWMATDPDHPVTCTPQQYATLARRC